MILFSGPSGIGKSTQAGLWTKYRKARVINGDRTLLKKENGRWMSLGWPICGSSEICYNEAYPVKAVIFLGQGNDQSDHSEWMESAVCGENMESYRRFRGSDPGV